MQELDPDISKKELYEIIIGSVAETFGIRHEDINNYTKRILQMAEKVSKLDAIPLCLCTVVLSLILTISGNTSNIFIIVAKNIVWETIPEDL